MPRRRFRRVKLSAGGTWPLSLALAQQSTTYGKAEKETYSGSKEGKEKDQAGAAEKIHVGFYEWEAS